MENAKNRIAQLLSITEKFLSDMDQNQSSSVEAETCARKHVESTSRVSDITMPTPQSPSTQRKTKLFMQFYDHGSRASDQTPQMVYHTCIMTDSPNHSFK